MARFEEYEIAPTTDFGHLYNMGSQKMGKIAYYICCMSIFIYWSFIYARKIENRYISALIVGCSSIIYMHMIINMGMISGLLPVTGLPAPFISYGGSFFLTCSILVGLINNAINNHI